MLVGYGPLAETSARPRRRSRSADWVAAHAIADDAAAVALAARRVGPKVLPPVRKLAHDLGVDLNKVEGTGKDGMITREDVLHVVSGAASAPVRRPRPGRRASSRPAGGSTTASRRTGAGPATARRSVPGSSRAAAGGGARVRIPVAGVRKQTAAAMVASAFTAPHASTSLTVDVTPTLELLEQFRADRALAGHRISILTLVAKAVTIALGRNPSLNAHWDDAAGEIVAVRVREPRHRRGRPRAGCSCRASRTPTGSGSPSWPTRSAPSPRPRGRARTTPADLAGGTITITNIGVLGVDTGTPILVPGQAAILAMGAIRRQPWEFQDQIALRHVMTLSVSFDHRLVDGAEAAHFLTDVGAILARPGSVLAWCSASSALCAEFGSSRPRPNSARTQLGSVRTRRRRRLAAERRERHLLAAAARVRVGRDRPRAVRRRVEQAERRLRAQPQLGALGRRAAAGSSTSTHRST